VTTPISSRMEPAAPVRTVFVGGPWDGRGEMLKVPGGIPTIVPVDVPLGYYVREVLLPDGRWRMAWRGFDMSAG
jgi:hypothetical protein